MRVRAAVVRRAGATPSVEEIDLPDASAGEVRVAVRAAGVCHSDLSMVDGTFAPSFPLVLGHEAAGTVVETGSGVGRVRVGDLVVLNWAPACRACWFCARGEPWLCERGMTPSAPRGTLADGTPLHVTLGLGALAEQVVVPEAAVIPAPAGVPAESAALLGCAVVTGFGAVRTTAGVSAGDAVAVVGVGGVGLAVVAAASAAGAQPVVAVDVSPAKRDLALSAGATDFLEPADTLSRQVRAMTGGRGVDHAFECVGRAETIRTAWRLARRGGTCTVVGIGRRDDSVEFNAAELFHMARTLRSSVFGSSDPDTDVPALAQAVLVGDLDPGLFVSHRGTLDGVGAALDRMAGGVGARTLVTFPQS